MNGVRDYSGLLLEKIKAIREPLCTPRQMDIWERVALGMPGKQIAADLKISIKTYDAHLAHIKERVGARGIADLTRAAIAAGLITVKPALGAAQFSVSNPKSKRTMKTNTSKEASA